MQIPVALVREAAELVLARLDEVAGAEVSVPDDYYWAIGRDELFDVNQEPSDLTIGQLTECLDNLKALVDEPDRATTYSQVWVSDLLRAIGRAWAGGSGWNVAMSPRSPTSPPTRACPTATSAASCASRGSRQRFSSGWWSTVSPRRSASTTCASWPPCRGMSSLDGVVSRRWWELAGGVISG